MTAPVQTCRRGHLRTAGNVKVRTITRNGRDYVIHDCKDCRAERAREKRVSQ